MKRKIEDVIEMYDGEGLTIMEIVEKTGLTEQEVLAIVTEYSGDFA
jgi:hypothetical protein